MPQKGDLQVEPPGGVLAEPEDQGKLSRYEATVLVAAINEWL
ncbi:hypothetical protein [Actinacidiphila soli]|nr:hypothetical protein [Actinacidiphila soli]